MDKKTNPNLGDEIKDMVQDALSSMDFNQLNKNISNTVNSALKEAKEGINKGQQQAKSVADHTREQIKRTADYSRYSPRTVKSRGWDKLPAERMSNLPVSKSPAGRISGILLLIFGWIGTGISGTLLLILCLTFGLLGRWIMFRNSLIILVPLLLISFLMASNGSRLRKRVKRFRLYVRSFAGKTFCSLDQLTSALGKDKRYVVKDVKKMITLGMFPEAHIDEQETCLMLDDETYAEYCRMQEGIRIKKQEEEEKRLRQEQEMLEEANNPIIKQAREAIAAGEETIRQIREANDAIPEEEISKKLDRLEFITGKIYHYVSEHPEELPEIRKFVEYYLPTTLKLVKAYQELNAQPIQGENILTAKKEIQDTLDTINSAFEKLVDSFYEETAMDISTDISVLQTMLAQEGLTNDSFNK